MPAVGKVKAEDRISGFEDGQENGGVGLGAGVWLHVGVRCSEERFEPVNGELLNFRLQDNGTGRAITWGAQFRSMTSTLPTTTVANKTHRILCEWNSGDSTWDCLAVSAQP